MMFAFTVAVPFGRKLLVISFSAPTMAGILMEMAYVSASPHWGKKAKIPKRAKIDSYPTKEIYGLSSAFLATFLIKKDVQYLMSKNTIGKIGEPQRNIFNLISIINGQLKMELMERTTSLFIPLMDFQAKMKITNLPPLI
ncbi:MAG: hypothetical protein Ct9H300mP4_18290 [Gammaproteobacteria bacterium]|nr:MAG: hypothetical protein Ct9H300mP4_18290 [Gammaproteobacteria bacterium]